ncbi:ATP-dependent DNA helicase RecG [Thiohalorhabdus denitrificans]|uniref:ATP-dependent DNA helicase RecG n=1 Tax=Thiohalorhabdus denitrificans TaxID=381306 RepID=A0A1G5AIT0_9GAMM|nr:ATP-dependent DNA helicase RecG [Thiohalorhabdus denitrificans]SCX77786.1 ATP-dependent DNA helicase RecG [Thiohalorhabdus denitrificans]
MTGRGSGRPLTELSGLGPRMAERLERLGVTSQEGLLFHLPYRYQDRTRVTAIGALAPDQEAGCQGVVRAAEVVGRRRPMFVARIEDGTGFLTLRFFQVREYLKRSLRPGRGVWAFGTVRAGQAGLEMVHPELETDAEEPPEAPAHLTPVYAATEGLTQGRLRAWIGQALSRAGPRLSEHLPAEVRGEHGWPALAEALETVHRPPADADVEALTAFRTPAQQRLAFEELLAHHLALRKVGQGRRSARAPVLEGTGELTNALLASLPFALTGAQERAWAEVRGDLRGDHPMQRLIQGDVGSGKTVVAALALLQAVEAGYQAALMAPTEILAEQHAVTLTEWLRPLGLEVHWLAGSLPERERRAQAEAMANGAARVVVGTHALFQKEVHFAELGLVVIDEQHRFGVHQRMALKEKGPDPHLLIMTATPIPRTLAMTAFADLEGTVIDELPPGRQPVDTVGISDARREEVEARVREAVAGGQQAYWVCPLVDESEMLQLEAATATHERLQAAFPELSIGLVHGRMTPEEKEAAMAAFKEGATHLLVATPVIEVGVDVPNATLMVIEHAERMGLAQLHQLRGRVGRGSRKSACVLLYHPPLGEKAKWRIAAMRETNDGFRIAQVDLELRGPGEVLGTRQTGLEQMRIADLGRDRDLITALPGAADVLLRTDPEAADALIRRWVGDRAVYGEVG